MAFEFQKSEIHSCSPFVCSSKKDIFNLVSFLLYVPISIIARFRINFPLAHIYIPPSFFLARRNGEFLQGGGGRFINSLHKTTQDIFCTEIFGASHIIRTLASRFAPCVLMIVINAEKIFYMPIFFWNFFR